MTSKKTIIQYLDQMYTDELDQSEFSSILTRLNKMGSVVDDIIFGLIQTADPDRKRFLFQLLGEIGDQKTVAGLRDIITNPDQADETKLIAAVTASQIDGYFDSHLLQNQLADPQGLGKSIFEGILDKSDNPFFIQMFLENFPRIMPEGQYAALEDLLQLKGDRRVINIVGPLIELVDDDLLEYIVPILLNSHDSVAFDYLQYIIKKTESKDIQNLARQAIFKLGTYVKEDKTPQQPQYKFHQAFATTIDGSGSSIFIFSVVDNDNKIRFIDFVNNDLQGIKDAFGGVFKPKNFNRFINKLKGEKGFLAIKVPPSFILEKIENAEELSKQVHRSLPVEYLAFQTIFKDVSYDDEYENIKQKYADLKKQILADSDNLLNLTENLYDYEEIKKSWFIDYELMAEPVEKYTSLEAEHRNTTDHEIIDHKIDKLMIQTSKNLFNKDFLSLLSDRLRDYALLCFIGKKKERAKLAIVAAETLFRFYPEKHPFLVRMLEHSFEVFLSEDEFEEFDEWDDDEFYGNRLSN